MTNLRKTRAVTATTVADGKTEHIRHEDLPHLFADVSGITASNAEINILDGATLDVNELNILDGVTADKDDLNLLDGMAAGAAGLEKVAKVALAGAGGNSGGGLGAWTNPESGSILIEKVLVDVTTVAAAACLIDVGSQATGLTTLSDNLLDGVDVHTATGVLAVADQAGVNGKTRQKLAAAKFVTFSTQTGGSDAASGLVGSGYIFYVLA